MTSDKSPEEKIAEARAEKIAFMIMGLIVLALVAGFLLMGITGVGLVAVAIVPVIYYC